MGWAEEWVKPGWNVLDIGANQGLFTKPFVDAVGPTGHVYAIEPQIALAENLRAYGTNVLVLTVAVGATEGAIRLYETAQTEHASLYPANVLAPTGVETLVRCVTLDGLQARGEIPMPIHVIKIDTQGAEAAILAGASHLIETQHPVIYLEVWPEGLRNAGSSFQAVIAWLKANRYTPQDTTWEELHGRCLEQSGHASSDVLVA